MSTVLRVALLGFNTIERATLVAGFRQAAERRPGYALVADLEGCDLVLADADHAAAVRLVRATDRLADTVFVGQATPAGAATCVARPIDPRHLMREFDALLAARTRVGSTVATLPMPAALSVTAARAKPLAAGADTDTAANPAQDQAGAAPPPLSANGAEAPASTPPAESAPAALVVDDSETARHSLVQCLQRWGFAVEQAQSSGQALGLLSRRDFDSVFIDVDLGPASVLDGFALCQQLKRQPRMSLGPPMWVAMVTALDGASDRVRGTLAGCDAYLVKPVDETELARLLWHQGWVPAPTRPPAPGSTSPPS